MILLLFVLLLAVFLGIELISRVPSILHTPLMSATNAISGITVVGALIVLLLGGSALSLSSKIIGFFAVMFAMINVVGGYYVTHRMLKLFKKQGEVKDA